MNNPGRSRRGMALEDVLIGGAGLALVYALLLAIVPIWVAWGIWRIGTALNSQRKVNIDAGNLFLQQATRFNDLIAGGAGRQGAASWKPAPASEGPAVASQEYVPVTNTSAPVQSASRRPTQHVSPRVVEGVNVGLAGAVALAGCTWLAGLFLPFLQGIFWTVAIVAALGAIVAGIVRLGLVGSANAPPNANR